MTTPVDIPPAFAAHVASLPPDALDPAVAVSGDAWLAGLPRLVSALLDEWSLTPNGPSRHGRCALAVPVTAPEGAAVLKVSWPHLEAGSEHLALRHWDGHGAVRLLRADPRRFALLLERLDATTDLTDVWIDEACETIGGLLRQLASPAIARTPTLSAYAARQAAAPGSTSPRSTSPRSTSLGRTPTAPDALPPRFVDQARHLAADLGRDPAIDAHLLHTDLHFANVLAGERQPWLAIDPKPMAGDPSFEVAPLLWNRVDELGTGSAIRWGLRRRVEVVCDAAGLDEERARAWAIVRVVDWARATTSADVGLAVAILKAMND